MLKITAVLLILTAVVTVNGYLCYNWCPNQGNDYVCCDPRYSKPLPVQKSCPPLQVCLDNPADYSEIESCNRWEKDKKCKLNGELCCPDDCAQKYICKHFQGLKKKCPVRECPKNNKAEDLGEECSLSDDTKKCGVNQFCCPDDCTSTYKCMDPVYAE